MQAKPRRDRALRRSAVVLGTVSDGHDCAREKGLQAELPGTRDGRVVFASGVEVELARSLASDGRKQLDGHFRRHVHESRVELHRDVEYGAKRRQAFDGAFAQIHRINGMAVRDVSAHGRVSEFFPLVGSADDGDVHGAALPRPEATSATRRRSSTGPYGPLIMA